MPNFPLKRNQVMTVGRVVRDGDRTLLYKNPTPTGGVEYHIIAKADCKIQAGDVIEYEPYGYNFGWLVDEPC